VTLVSARSAILELLQVIVSLLFFFWMGDKNTSAVELSQLLPQSFSLEEFLFGDRASLAITNNSPIKGQGKLRSFLLDPQVRLNKLEKDTGLTRTKVPGPAGFQGKWAPKIASDMASNASFQMLDGLTVGIGYSDTNPMRTKWFSLLVKTDADMTFAIKQACQISSLCHGNVCSYLSPFANSKSFAGKVSDNRGMGDPESSTDGSSGISALIHQSNDTPLMRHEIFVGASSSDKDFPSSQADKNICRCDAELSGESASGRTRAIQRSDFGPFFLGQPSVDFSVLVDYDAFSHDALLPKEGFLVRGRNLFQQVSTSVHFRRLSNLNQQELTCE
jgi:hypothetical protein